MKGKVLCIDFDGVIHRYSRGWHDGTAYDEPMPGAIESMLKLRDQGFDIYIFSVRPTKQINEWLGVHWPKGKPLPKITEKKIVALAYIDDRAIRFTNWADITKYFL